MKAHNYIYVIVSVVAMLGFCSCTEKNIDTPQSGSAEAISFSDVATKASLSDLQSDGFGVWAFITNSAVTNHVLMDNQSVTYNGSIWEYSPLRYWIDETVFTFIATYPYDEDGTYYTLDSENRAIQLSVDETPSQEDYLIATNETDTNETDYETTVDLQFRHLLTNVGMKIWREGAKHQNDQIRIKKVTLGNIRKAGTYSSNTGTWALTSDRVAVEKVYNEFSDDDNIGAALVNDDGTLTTGGTAADPFNEMMLVPQTLDASNRVSLRIIYELKRLNAADWEEAELETVLPDITWESNKRYTYNVVLSSVTDITIYYIQTKVDPWGTPQVGGTVIIK